MAEIEMLEGVRQAPRGEWNALVGDESLRQPMAAYGHSLGMAFQIADDLLDYGGDAKATGKNVGDDFRERKLTLPVIKAVAKADEADMAALAKSVQDEKPPPARTKRSRFPRMTSVEGRVPS